MAFLILLSALSLLGIAASVRAIATDGYRRTPVEPSHLPEPRQTASTSAQGRPRTAGARGIPGLRARTIA